MGILKSILGGFDLYNSYTQGKNASDAAKRALDQQGGVIGSQTELARRAADLADRQFASFEDASAQELALMKDAYRREVERDKLSQELIKRNLQISDEDYADQLDTRDRYRSRTEEMMGAIEDAFGALPDSTGRGESEINAEANRRKAAYQTGVDRAIDRVASTGRAKRIMDGMGESSLDIAENARMMSAAAEAYAQADGRAYDEAVKFISGLNAEDRTNDAHTATLRSNDLSELLGLDKALLGMEFGDPQPGSRQLQGFNPSVSAATGYRPAADTGSSFLNNAKSGLGSAASGFGDIGRIYGTVATGYGKQFGERREGAGHALDNSSFGQSLNKMFNDTFSSNSAYEDNNPYNNSGW